MTRIIAIALTASAVSLWAVSAKATDLRPQTQSVTAPSLQIAPLSPRGGFYPPAHAWPRINHGPAITKTLQNAPQFYAAPQVPAPQYESDWQRQPAPPAPAIAPPRFSYPQQGYYPREGHVPQAPGYEYDFGGGASFPPAYPMEGAAWREPNVQYRATGFSGRQPATNGHITGTYAECPR